MESDVTWWFVKKIKKRPKATGKQLSIFDDEVYGKQYRYSLYVTNNKSATPQEIWNYYRSRANDENIIKYLKDGFGLSAYNNEELLGNGSRAYDHMSKLPILVTMLVKQVIHPADKERKLRSLRMEYLVVPALLGKDGRDDVLRLGLSNPKRRTKFTQILDKIRDMELIFYCNAVELEEVV